MNTRIFELPCLDSRKSFYGKAHVIEHEDGLKELLSYETIVCSIDSFGKFHKLWDGYSSTTMRHINSFLAFYGIREGGKAFWDALPTENEHEHNSGGRLLTNDESYAAMMNRRNEGKVC